MREVELSQGKVCLVDDEDYEKIMNFKWVYDKGYAYTSMTSSSGKRIRVSMHRYLMNTPKGMEVDHINQVTLDNRKENLRNCTKAENHRNRSKYSNNTSGYRGVGFHKGCGKYVAKIRLNNVVTHIGVYDNPEDAARAYDAKAIELHGEFAHLNFEKSV